jgi:phosphoribosylglycinamide formyltransferase
MIHYVIAAVDRGDAILTEEVECRAGESLEQLEERIHGVEHGLIVRATSKIVQELAAKRK